LGTRPCSQSGNTLSYLWEDFINLLEAMLVTILNPKEIEKYLKNNHAAEKDLLNWKEDVETANWISLSNIRREGFEIREIHKTESYCRIVFKLQDRYRVDVEIYWIDATLRIFRIGTHEAYNKWRWRHI